MSNKVTIRKELATKLSSYLSLAEYNPSEKFKKLIKVFPGFRNVEVSGNYVILSKYSGKGLDGNFFSNFDIPPKRSLRDLLRKMATATCLAQFRKRETRHEDAAESFMSDMFDELTNIQRAIGK